MKSKIEQNTLFLGKTLLMQYLCHNQKWLQLMKNSNLLTFGHPVDCVYTYQSIPYSTFKSMFKILQCYSLNGAADDDGQTVIKTKMVDDGGRDNGNDIEEEEVF